MSEISLAPARSLPPARTALPLALALFVFLLLASHLAPFVPDDSYISFRYAEHLGRGLGLAYNPADPPVEGYSNFLWILVCSGLERCGLDIARWAPRIGIALGMATLAVLWRLLVRRRSPIHQLTLVLLLLATSGPFVLYAVSGLETPLCSFLLLLAIFCAERAHESRPGWLLGLATTGILFALTRPEGALLFPVLLGLLLVAPGGRLRRAEILIASGLFLAVMGAYEAWRVSYFGELFPTPLLSKGSGGAFLRAWATNLRHLFWRQNQAFAPLGYYYAALLGMAAVAGGWRAVADRGPLLRWWPAGLAILYGAVYLNFVDWMPGMRYWVPLIGLWLAALGGDGNHALFAPPGRPRKAALGAAYALVLVLGMSSVAIVARDGRRNEASTQRSLVALGHWLRANAPSRAVLAMSDVGATPYYSRLATIDINPRSLTDLEIAHHGWSDRYFFRRQPDLVVLVSFSAREPVFYRVHQRLYDGRRFQRQYRLIGVARYDDTDRSYWVFAGDWIRFTPEQLATFPAGLGR
jgi:hypothetical protein